MKILWNIFYRTWGKFFAACAKWMWKGDVNKRKIFKAVIDQFTIAEVHVMESRSLQFEAEYAETMWELQLGVWKWKFRGYLQFSPPHTCKILSCVVAVIAKPSETLSTMQASSRANESFVKIANWYRSTPESLIQSVYWFSALFWVCTSGWVKNGIWKIRDKESDENSLFHKQFPVLIPATLSHVWGLHCTPSRAINCCGSIDLFP